MKRMLTIFLCIFVVMGVYAEGEVTKLYQPVFTANNPEMVAQGFSFTANGAGYNTFFSNPAGYGLMEADLNLLSVSTWVRMNPQAFIDDYNAATGSDILNGEVNDMEDESGLIDLALAQVLSRDENGLPANGVGVGVSSGIGWAGKHLALGFITNFDSAIWGDPIPSVQAWVDVAAIIGLGLDFDLGPGKLIIGGDVRPMVRAYVEPTIDDVMAFAGMGESETETETETETAEVSKYEDLEDLGSFAFSNALYGSALGVDLGIIYQWGGLSAGFSMRDVGNTLIQYDSYTIEELYGMFVEDDSYDGTALSDVAYYMPMRTSLGLSYDFDFGIMEWLLDPTIHVSLEDPFGLDPGTDNQSFWSRLNMGADLRVLTLVDLWGGFSGGYATLGAQINLLICKINMAVYTEEFGANSGEWPVSGVSAEVAFRY